MKPGIAVAAVIACGAVLAKLPSPDDAAKATAAEAAARAAWQAKVDAFKLCKVQDTIAARFRGRHPAEAQAEPGAAVATALPAAAPASSSGAPLAKATASSAGNTVTAKAMPPASPASSTGGAATPAAATASAQVVPPCSDPGPFASTPPEQKPLEASGAHSPVATAASPPSVATESGKMTSGKK